MSSADKFTDLPSVIVVPLLRLTKCHHGGLMLTTFNKDFTCFVNKEILLSEINLLGGKCFSKGLWYLMPLSTIFQLYRKCFSIDSFMK
jgi:hypothetical protein